MNGETTTIDRGVRTMQMIYGILFLTLFFYSAPLFFLSQKWPEPTVLAAKNPLVLVLGMVAMSQIGVIPFIRRLILGKIHMQAPLIEKIRGVQTVLIVTLALAESIAVFGFVAAFLTQNVWVYAPFLAVSVVLFVIYAPRRTWIETHLGLTPLAR